MTSKSSNLSSNTVVILRVFVIALSLYGSIWVITHSYQAGWQIVTAFTSGLLIWELITYLNRIHLEISQFTEAVKYRDFTQFYNTRNSPLPVRDLRLAFNEVNHTFKKLNAEKETQYYHLKTILELIDTGILSYDEDGSIKWMNDSFRKLFALPSLNTLDGLIARNQDLRIVVDSRGHFTDKLIKITSERRSLSILISTATFKVDGKMNYLIAVKNVDEAIDETETLAWQKLLRVLTHEIMNSVAPITSLAETIQQRLAALRTSEGSPLLDDMSLSIEVIRNRSEGLLRFAETYRSLSKITSPAFTPMPVYDIFEHLKRLMEQEALQRKLELTWELRDPGMIINVDISLVEQVLLNLLINAMDALGGLDDGRIKVLAFMNEKERPVIQVSDNGPGIPEELLETVFVPFFTTKKQGSGIGLSLTKQIMQIHKGSVLVESREGAGSKFRLVF